jgi:hypothetical protein
MSEFVALDFPVHIANLGGIKKTVAFNELFPMSFKLPPSAE